jgi:hypothetical protein
MKHRHVRLPQKVGAGVMHEICVKNGPAQAPNPRRLARIDSGQTKVVTQKFRYRYIFHKEMKRCATGRVAGWGIALESHGNPATLRRGAGLPVPSDAVAPPHLAPLTGRNNCLNL